MGTLTNQNGAIIGKPLGNNVPDLLGHFMGNLSGINNQVGGLQQPGIVNLPGGTIFATLANFMLYMLLIFITVVKIRNSVDSFTDFLSLESRSNRDKARGYGSTYDPPSQYDDPPFRD